MNQTELTSIIQPLDCVCTAASSALASFIRLISSKRVGKSGIAEAFKMRVANHCGLIVYEAGVYKVAEMLGTGLELNPISDYFKTKSDRIIAVRRLQFPEIYVMNQRVLSIYETGTLNYSVKELFNFVGIGRNVPKNMYCSEFCEIVANSQNLTWSHNQLFDRTRVAGIAPCEIQFGCGESVYDERN